MVMCQLKSMVVEEIWMVRSGVQEVLTSMFAIEDMKKKVFSVRGLRASRRDGRLWLWYVLTGSLRLLDGIDDESFYFKDVKPIMASARKKEAAGKLGWIHKFHRAPRGPVCRRVAVANVALSSAEHM